MKGLIDQLKVASHGHKSKLWRRIASDLQKPTRQRRVVNLSRINRSTKEDETIIVPGKVLGAGILDHKLTIAALAFSSSAIDKIKSTNGTVLSIADLMKEDPKGKRIRIIG